MPWEMLYVDDLVLVTESMEDLNKKKLRWNECIEAKDLKINICKTKGMVSGKNRGDVKRTGKWWCAVREKVVQLVIFVCKVCEKAEDGEDINIQVRMDLRNGACLDRIGEDLLNGGCAEWTDPPTPIIG